MSVKKKTSSKLFYEKPELIEIQMLDESAMGESAGGMPEEPPPPGEAPGAPNSGMPMGQDIPPGP